MVVVALGQQYNIAEKPAVMLDTYITATQVHQKRSKSLRCTKLNLSMLTFDCYRIQVLVNLSRLEDVLLKVA